MDTGVYTSWNSYLAEWLMAVARVAHHGGLMCVCVYICLSINLLCTSVLHAGDTLHPAQFDLGRKEIRFWCWLCKTNVAFAPLLTPSVDKPVHECVCARVWACVQCFTNFRIVCVCVDACVCVHVSGAAWLKDVLVEWYWVVSAVCSLSPQRGGRAAVDIGLLRS